ncbi:FadR/GntR family transcriptional regulator [Aureimonas leprariae]|uniref:FadR family transcriptional regulator n=1 Tax=Plantimonas leprariae TaxID=2615207 RepID=A0A7V7TYF4_9HYPH|nr:FadR/GntR family transcriptional regulator [Aureimonas leprariae]KAB0677202.1 FadR family transcriptional regulator [Aureimonas leprariae]
MVDRGNADRDASGQPDGAAALAAPTLGPPRRSGGRRLSGSVHEGLAEEIGLRIVRGDYPPGTILPNEAKWAETFEVGRSGVREAMKMLTAKGLLGARPRIGTWVEPKERWNLLDRDVLGWYAAAPDRGAFLRTVQEFRHIIEPEATAFAALRRTEEQAEEIDAACRAMGAARSLIERTEADTRFHLAVLRASGNDLLVPLGPTIEAALNQLFNFVGREIGDLSRAQSLHEAISRGIAARRPDAARRAVRKLLANTDGVIERRAKEL